MRKTNDLLLKYDNIAILSFFFFSEKRKKELKDINQVEHSLQKENGKSLTNIKYSLSITIYPTIPPVILIKKHRTMSRVSEIKKMVTFEK